MKLVFLNLFITAVSLLQAQTKSTPVVIDGDPTDAFWTHASPGAMSPVQAGLPENGGEVRTTVSGRYLYLSARLPEPTGRFTARSIGKNPYWEEEDAIKFIIRATDNDWMLQVGPLGAWSVKWHWTGETDWYEAAPDKFAGFLVAAATGGREWHMEAAVPLSKLGSSANGEISIAAERVRAARPGVPEEHWHWPSGQPMARVVGTPSPDSAEPLFRPPLVGNTESPIEAGRRAALPPLETAWTSEAWRDVPVWALYRNEPLRLAPQFPTEVKMVHDGHTLSVMARCIEPEETGAEDSFQVYLATSGSSYVKYGVDPAGVIKQASGVSGGERIARPHIDWKSPVHGNAQRLRGEWIARLDIPLDFIAKTLGETSTPRDWRVLFVRSRPARDGELEQTSVLPVTETNTPYCPARYRRLALLDKDPTQVAGSPYPARTGNLAFVPTRVFTAADRKEMALPGMLGRNIHDRTLRILQEERKAWDRVQTVADWEQFRDPRQKALAASLGEFPAREPLQTRVVKQYRGDGYRREDIVYQTRPGFWVTANLYLPKEPKAAMPGIVIVHSLHAPKTQFENQDMGIMWARGGAAVLVMDQAGYGDRLEAYPWAREFYHSRYVSGMQLYLVGESLIKWMVWDIMRGIDLLLDRKDIDPKRIVLLGSVAGGGDPAAVEAALDPRVAAVVPFNFGESTPEIPRFLPDKNQWSLELADPGLGDWDTTRCLRRGVIDQFLQWTICAMAAPRGFVFSYELGWNVEDLPAWARYKKVWELYNARDRLADAHGFGPFPGPGECWNIGPAQRRTLHPTLERWFGIPVPFEDTESSSRANLTPRPGDRRPEAELAVLTPEAAANLHMRTMHELAAGIGRAKLEPARAGLAEMSPEARRERIRTELAKRLGDISPTPDPQAVVHWTKNVPGAVAEGIHINVEPDVIVPMLLLKPAGKSRAPVVVALAEGGKEAFFATRAPQIEALLHAGNAICLPDVRGTGETSPDGRRDAENDENMQAVNEHMLGETLLGRRLKDLRTVLAYLRRRTDVDGARAALWGESLAPVNDAHTIMDEFQLWQVGPQIHHQGEPLGGLLAILGALYEPEVRAVAVRNGLVSYAALLEDAFEYVPADATVPGFLEVCDLPDVVAAVAPRPVLLEDPIDGKNRLAGPSTRASRIPEWLTANAH
ncbi:MAG: acetylxylan esterase [Bryobacteraceae bacterium]